MGVNIPNGLNTIYSTNQSGDYRAIVSALGFADTSNTVILIEHTPAAGITQSGDTLFSTPAASYQWYSAWDTISGATQSSYVFTLPGWYYLTIIDSNGCPSSQSQFHAYACENIDLTNYPLTSTICQGNQVVLKAYVFSGIEYQWFLNDQSISGATSTQYHAYSAGQYFVITHKVSNNCRDTSSTYSLFIDNIIPPVIQQEADSLIASSSSSYQWYFNDSLIPGATNQIFIPIQSGSYQVEVTDSNSCVAISQSYNFIPTRINSDITHDFFDAFVENQLLFIRFHQSPLPLRMILFNDLGVKLKELAITQSELVIDVSQLAKGIYFITVDDEKKRSVKKIVIE